MKYAKQRKLRKTPIAFFTNWFSRNRDVVARTLEENAFVVARMKELFERCK